MSLPVGRRSVTLPAGGRRGSAAGDGGSALVEATWLGVLLLLPLAYLVLTVLSLERAALGAAQAARAAGRAYVVTAGDTAAALAAARLALRDQGLPLTPGELRVSCSASPCATAGALVTVRVATRVDLPFVPALLGRRAASVPVRARHDERIDCHRASVAAPRAGACP